MKNVWIASLLSIALVTLGGCDTLRRTLNIQNPTYRVRDIRPQVAIAIPFSSSTIDFDFDIEVDNPNPVGLRLDRIDFDLLINGSQISRGFSSDQVQIPANGLGQVQLRTRVGYNDLRSLFREIVDVVQGNQARYELRGRAYFKTPIGQMDFPITLYATGR